MAFIHPLGTIPTGASIFQNHADQSPVAFKLHATRVCIMRFKESSANEIIDHTALLPSPPKESNESCRAWQRHSSGRTFGHLGESLAVFGQITPCDVVKLIVVVVLVIITGIVICVVVICVPVRECRFNGAAT